MIEKKEIITFGTGQNSYVEDLLAFGWEKGDLVRGSRSGTGYRYTQVLTRDTENPHYNEFVKLEKEYEDAKKKIMYYEPAELFVVLILLLLLIIPGIIYMVHKHNQKIECEDNNRICRRIMKESLDAARKIK